MPSENPPRAIRRYNSIFLFLDGIKMNIFAWNCVPALSELAHFAERASPVHLLVCLNENAVPAFELAPDASAAECRLKTAIDENISCLQFNGINFLQNLLPNIHLWIAPKSVANRLNEYFNGEICWQTEAAEQMPSENSKPWLVPPKSARPSRVLVVGAGIAGAATARLFAEQGVSVCVLEAKYAACAASGNRQGLLYAKISPHATEQTDLLLAGYGFTRRLLQRILPDADYWGGQGVLHLNFDEHERRRNQALAAQTHHAHLYRAVFEAEADEVSGISVFSDGLYWPQGVWLNPPAVIRTLLEHPLIELHENTPLVRAEHDGENWHAHTENQTFLGSHIVYCTGAHSTSSPEKNLAALPLRSIRGQTGETSATEFSQNLRCALSGESYISPSWQGKHCYGASFVLNSRDESWQPNEETANRNQLHQLNAPLADSLFSDGINRAENAEGHTALRCDSPDHLPMAGALGDIAAMQQAYAKLALDKNYRISAPCPYLPNAYINTAHGTRGLATAPICAASLVAEILNLPQPLSQKIRTALHPNRTVARAIVRHQPLNI